MRRQDEASGPNQTLLRTASKLAVGERNIGRQVPLLKRWARADDLGGNFAKEAFHQMEPGEEVGMKWM